MRGLGEATFTEMFCPDWESDAVFMSHMGECNTALAADVPRLVEKDYAFGDVVNPAVAVFAIRPGRATLANIAHAPGGGFGVVAAGVEVLTRGPSETFPDVPHFWLRPLGGDLRRFLRAYSELGGTHHLALLPGAHEDALRRMARMLDLEFVAL